MGRKVKVVVAKTVADGGLQGRMMSAGCCPRPVARAYLSKGKAVRPIASSKHSGIFRPTTSGLC